MQHLSDLFGQGHTAEQVLGADRGWPSPVLIRCHHAVMVEVDEPLAVMLNVRAGIEGLGRCWG
ncbi:MAG: hypothetical protein CGW95_02265 [Phenylobacterium zucineum]|nr:MAG: hypothetical protein CGW95_02265 [Phenylobacterium zucineum]